MKLNDAPVSTAMLMDPKALKKHLANGITSSSHSASTPRIVRQNSEPLQPPTSLPSSKTLHAFPPSTNDDSNGCFTVEGKKSMNSHQAQPLPLSNSVARRLLEPEGFDKLKRQRDEIKHVDESLLLSPLNSVQQQTTEKIYPLNSEDILEPQTGEYEGPGIGNLIERVHNVSQREERPSKKQKTEPFEDDDNDKGSKFGGGGKGGDLGEYIKEKKKEGIETGPVVDLTGGVLTRIKKGL